MSFQPTPTMVQPAVPPPPPAQQQQPPAKRGGSLLLWLGIGLLVAGIVGSIVTYVLQNNQYEQSVKKLARAVPGFSTRLDFQTSGTYSLYYENEGEFSAQLDGEPTDVKLDAPSAPVDFSATLTDGDGNDVRIHDSSDDLDYDVAGHRGTLVSTVDIGEPGDYHLQIASDDPAQDGANSYAVAIGKGQVSEPSVLWPVLILGAGLILGAVAIVAGTRQRRAPAAAATVPGAFVAPPPVSGPPGGYGYDPTMPAAGGLRAASAVERRPLRPSGAGTAPDAADVAGPAIGPGGCDDHTADAAVPAAHPAVPGGAVRGPANARRPADPADHPAALARRCRPRSGPARGGRDRRRPGRRSLGSAPTAVGELIVTICRSPSRLCYVAEAVRHGTARRYYGRWASRCSMWRLGVRSASWRSSSPLVPCSQAATRSSRTRTWRRSTPCGPASGCANSPAPRELNTKAQIQADRMANAGRIFHSANLATGVSPGWRLIGENVAQAGSLQAAESALERSAPHYANLTRRTFTQVGVGVTVKNGQVFVVQEFVAR